MRPLVEIQADIRRAKQRLGQLRAEEYQILLQYPCKSPGGCGAGVGQVCVKVCTRAKTAAHAQRHEAAKDAVVAAGKSKP